MADRFVTEATNTLAPVYDQQIAGIESQIPALQKLYESITSGLRTQNEAQINTGTQNIVEDASARGVLRSTLPVDTRQSLISTLGAALNQSLGQIGLQQTQDIGRIQGQIGELRTKKVTDIASLANTLGENDLARQKFEWQKHVDSQDLKLKAAAQAASRAANKGAPTGLVNNIYGTFNSKKGKDGFVSPNTFRAGLQSWINAGGSPSSFQETFSWAINPKHQELFGGYY